MVSSVDEEEGEQKGGEEEGSEDVVRPEGVGRVCRGGGGCRCGC